MEPSPEQQKFLLRFIARSTTGGVTAEDLFSALSRGVGIRNGSNYINVGDISNFLQNQSLEGVVSQIGKGWRPERRIQNYIY